MDVNEIGKEYFGKEAPASYYDAVYSQNWIETREKDLQNLYNTAADFLTPSDCQQTIIDIGCGVGGLAYQLLKKNIKCYCGFDFSTKAIAIAKNRTFPKNYVFANLSFIEYIQYMKYKLMPVANLEVIVYFCLEVLEHIENDLPLVEATPPGAKFIFSVPNFLCPGHVRKFDTIADVKARYGHLLEFQQEKIIVYEGATREWLFQTIRKQVNMDEKPIKKEPTELEKLTAILQLKSFELQSCKILQEFALREIEKIKKQIVVSPTDNNARLDTLCVFYQILCSVELEVLATGDAVDKKIKKLKEGKIQ